jgi:valyl-tRNA synthetase
MLLPPPNVTGVLHLGHSLTVAIQDAIIRYRRMKGDAVHWIPGIDHAGIATQAVVERHYWTKEGVSRNQMGRQMFNQRIWEHVGTYERQIREQINRLGASVDWESGYFTLDEKRSRFVEDAFIRLFEQGLIYRHTKLVNWCCYLQTAISDMEVEMVDIDQRSSRKIPGRTKEVEVGVLHSFVYPWVADHKPSNIELVVSTTRLETIFGDVALAVHPNDERYQTYIGKYVQHPFTQRRLPVIASHRVDPHFGTGILKVTPGHDKTDYDIVNEHGGELPVESILDASGRLNDLCGPEYAGLDRFDARQRVREALLQKGLYRGHTNHRMRLAICSRTGDIVEWLLKPQW